MQKALYLHYFQLRNSRASSHKSCPFVHLSHSLYFFSTSWTQKGLGFFGLSFVHNKPYTHTRTQRHNRAYTHTRTHRHKTAIRTQRHSLLLLQVENLGPFRTLHGQNHQGTERLLHMHLHLHPHLCVCHRPPIHLCHLIYNKP